MSSEQVIAALREYADLQDMVSASGGTFPVRLNGAYSSESLRSMADRLSTPAAGGAVAQDGERRAWVGVQKIDAEDNCGFIEHCADQLVQSGYNITARVLRSIADDYRQLQARNAEQAAEVERWQKVYAGIVVSIVQAGVPAFGTAKEGVEKLGAKLSALLDGIEGLEGQIRASSDMQLAPDYADALEDFADDLKALREKANGSQGERGDA